MHVASSLLPYVSPTNYKKYTDLRHLHVPDVYENLVRNFTISDVLYYMLLRLVRATENEYLKILSRV